MNLASTLVFALISAALAAPAHAQQPASPGTATPAAPATAAPPATAPAAGTRASAAGGTGPAASAPVQPALATLLGARAAELSAAGVEKIVARTGKNRRDIQVLTKYGPAYFGWPKDTTPVPFEIAVGPGNTASVRASGYSEATQARYAAAFDAVVPRALAQAKDLQTRALRPRP